MCRLLWFLQIYQEVIGVSDRIMVMHEGRISGELTRQEATQEKVMRLATGGQ